MQGINTGTKVALFREVKQLVLKGTLLHRLWKKSAARRKHKIASWKWEALWRRNSW